MANEKIKKVLVSSPDYVDGYQMPNIVEVSVSNGFIWFTREGLSVRWKESDWTDLVSFVDDQINPSA